MFEDDRGAGREAAKSCVSTSLREMEEGYLPEKPGMRLRVQEGVCS